ncbi:cytochrome P450 family protein [Bacillus solimangrovi]|uniref:Cytochrome n=1 Tax=Bacillus solimangrovi TaxID=1305675 RepID=A0A1E5LAG8_9BACI|nr:cytochrome P450 [Bacillus solimangrovi]OEH91093.1 cytochrome [Bacillus solimangrovi]
MEKVVFDLYSSEYQHNPYPTLEYFREHDPIHPFYVYLGDIKANAWLITRYQDVLALFNHKYVTKDVINNLNEEEKKEWKYGSNIELIFNNMLFKDPPDHSRLRTLVHKVFTPKMISELKNRIEQISIELIEKMKDKKNVDLLDDYAYPLPVTVISEMMGIPKEDRNKFRVWSKMITDISNNAEEVQKFESSIQEFMQYLEETIEKRKKVPSDDIISGLVIVEENGEMLSHNELLSMLLLLIVAGHETTVNLIGNGMLALLQHRDQLEKLRENPEYIKTAIEELLRFTNPVEFATERYAREDFIFHGNEIKKGDFLFLGLAAANRDPLQFANPNELDITRHPNKHLAFGHGIHACLGAPLARLEGQVAFQHLLEHFPNISLDVDDKEIIWRRSEIFRGLEALPIHW